MMIIKKVCLFLVLGISQAIVCAAQFPSGFSVRVIDKQVKDFTLDSICLSTPLDYYLSRAWVMTTGKAKFWADISTCMFEFDPNASDEPIGEDSRNGVLNEHIDAVVSYRDTVAAILTHPEENDFVLLNYCWIEDGKWVNRGQGIADNISQAKSILLSQLPANYANLPRIAQIKSLPADEAPFVSFLSGIDSSTEEFVMEMLRTHKLVINGEYHRRKVSWDMLKRLIALPEFSDRVGCIFMELPSWCQAKMDAFLASDTLDAEAVLDIFREEQPHGWWDRGEFEFICEVWRLNQSLPVEKRIRIVLADYQIPYSSVTRGEDWREQEDRNTHMAGIVAETVLSSSDGRNHLFLVGCGHAFKSKQAGFASAAEGEVPALTAAAQLADRLGTENVFALFQHALSSDNSGNHQSLVRGGVFDRAFAANGNRPVGFKLAGSPFGNEPFDGIYEIAYNEATGSYADNFDGYLFLHPLSDEPQAEPLTEIFTDEFVEEMKRRASVAGNGHVTSLWLGRKAQDLTKEYILELLQKE